jgi:hypothetical protein
MIKNKEFQRKAKDQNAKIILMNFSIHRAVRWQRIRGTVLLLKNKLKNTL